MSDITKISLILSLIVVIAMVGKMVASGRGRAAIGRELLKALVLAALIAGSVIAFVYLYTFKV